MRRRGWDKQRHQEKGAIGIFMILTVVTTLGLAALVVDVGVILMGRARLKTGLDAACLAASQEMPDTAAATDRFNEYIALNLPANSVFSVPETTITFPGELNNSVQASGTLNANLSFMKVLGTSIGTVGGTSEAQNAAPDLILVTDRSGSMCEDSHGPGYPGSGYPTWQGYCPDAPTWEPLQSVEDAAISFTNNITPQALLGLVSYSTNPALDVPLTGDVTAVQSALNALAPGGYTGIGDSIYEAADELLTNGRQSAPKVMVLLTDGRANTVNGAQFWSSPWPADYTRDAAQYAAQNGIIIFTIAFGDQADQDLMADVADITDGKFYYAPTSADLQPIFDDIAEQDYIRLVPTS